MRKLLAWCRSRPSTIVLSVCLAPPLVAILGAFGAHLFLNWQAERRWQVYAADAPKCGVSFEREQFAPPKIPESENFAMIPMMRAIFVPKAKSPMALPIENRPSFGDRITGKHFDWEKWQTYSSSL